MLKLQNHHFFNVGLFLVTIVLTADRFLLSSTINSVKPMERDEEILVTEQGFKMADNSSSAHPFTKEEAALPSDSLDIQQEDDELELLDLEDLLRILEENLLDISKEPLVHSGNIASVPSPRTDSSQPSLESFDTSNQTTSPNSVSLNQISSPQLLPSNQTLNASSDPLMCPLVPPYLSGPVKIRREAPLMEKLEKIFENKVQIGGRYFPPDCRSRHRAAIIVPYRNRSEQLPVFLQHMHDFLPRQQIDYTIYLIEQAGNASFNRAMLMNIGVVEASKQGDFQCFIFHDVDLLPEDDRNIYSCPEQPRHMSVAVDTLKYKLPYEGLFGGASAMSKSHVEKVNGFSNLFWGWGGEDDDMANRIRHNRLTITRYPANIARYTMLSHKKEKPNPQKENILRHGVWRSRTDGLSSLRYERLKLELKPLYTWILADVQPA